MSAISVNGDSSFLFTMREWISQPHVSSFIAGGIAGAASRTVVSPLERLKILLQVQTPGKEPYRLGIGKALLKMLREEGFVRGFFAGNMSNVVRIVPYSSIQYGSYNVYKQFFESSPGASLSPLQRMLCGACAGLTSVMATYPLDITRTRLSIQSASLHGLKANTGKKMPGMWQTMKHLYLKEGGVRALYGGLFVTSVGVAPYCGINFAVYGTVRQWMTPEDQSSPGTFATLASGAISGAIAQTFTYPLDVLRRRLQVNTMSGLGYQYKGLWDAVRTITATEGLRFFTSGLSVNLLKVAPSMATSWLSFELARDFLVGLKLEEPRDAA